MHLSTLTTACILHTLADSKVPLMYIKWDHKPDKHPSCMLLAYCLASQPASPSERLNCYDPLLLLAWSSACNSGKLHLCSLQYF